MDQTDKNKMGGYAFFETSCTREGYVLHDITYAALTTQNTQNTQNTQSNQNTQKTQNTQNTHNTHKNTHFWVFSLKFYECFNELSALILSALTLILSTHV